jgi:hypothetical protein
MMQRLRVREEKRSVVTLFNNTLKYEYIKLGSRGGE